MNPAPHSYEEKLLELVYGELDDHEVRAVEAHLKGCARCSGALEEIRGVRRVMSALPAEPAPDAGLESLLAYADIAAARHVAEGPARRGRWRRWIAPLSAAAALAAVVVVSVRAIDLKQPAPQSAASPSALARSEQPSPASDAVAGAPAESPLQAARSSGAQAEDSEEPQKLALADKRRAPAQRAQLKDRLPRELELGGKGSLAVGPSSDSYRDQANRPPRSDEKLAYNSGEGARAKKKSAPMEPRGEGAGAASNRLEEAQPSAMAAEGLSKSGSSAVGSVATREVERQRAKEESAEGRTSEMKVAPKPSAPPAKSRMAKAVEVDSASELDEHAYDSAAPATASAPGRAAAPSSAASAGARSAPPSAEPAPSAPAPSTARAPAQQPRYDAAAVKQKLALARAARSKGDLDAEVEAASAALQAGASGADRAEALQRLCEVLDADDFCAALVREFPDSSAARATVRRRGEGGLRKPAQ